MASEADIVYSMESDCSLDHLMPTPHSDENKTDSESTPQIEKESTRDSLVITNAKSKLVIGALVAIAIASGGATLMGCLDVLGVGS